LRIRIPRFHFLFALFAAAGGLIGAGTEGARGSAGLMPPDDGQVIAATFFSDSTQAFQAFDAQGHLIPVPAYKKFRYYVANSPRIC
jgi:hypothetical protein